MKRFMNRNAATGLIGLTPFIALISSPAAAQDFADDESATEKVNLVMVYGEDTCPPSTDGEIVVCARLDEGERYRIPEELRTSSDPSNFAWATRAKSLETVGNFGTMSCSATGAGGWTGCTQELINAAYAEKANAPDVQYSLLIEEERRRRLGNIDEDAAAEQARVEQIEREYMRRLEQERAGTSGAPVTGAADTAAGSAGQSPSTPPGE